MKNNMALYKAMGNIDDNIIKETDDYQAEKKDRSRLFTALEAVAVVAVVCGFVVLSMVLTKISGPKTDPAASREEITDALTDAVYPDPDRIPDKSDPSAVTPVKQELTGDELYALEAYKDFLPKTLPNLFTDSYAYRIVPGEYKQNDGKTRYVDEEWYIYLGAPDSDGIDTNWLDITIKKLDEKEAENVVDADKLSTSLIKNSRVLYSDPYGNRTWKLMLRYSITFKADGCEIIYRYTKLSGEVTDKSSPVNPTPADYAALDKESQLSPEYLFTMITSAPYFEAHPVTEYEASKQRFCVEDTGKTLTLEFNSDKYGFNSVMELTATLRNDTDHDVTILVPVTAPEHSSHKEIQIDIYREDNNTVRFTDMDTYGVCFETAESYLTLKPGEEYVQKMRMTGDIEAFTSVPQGAVEQIGVYTCIATVRFADSEGNPAGEIVGRFEINIG